MSAPAISVIMSAYNAERYLREAVESILNQTYDNFELIIINDGSTDRTADILSGFSDPRIRILEQDNKGLATALNRGLAEARAPLIARMDADDTCTTDRLEREIAVLQACPDVDVVSARIQHMDANGKLLDLSYPPRFPKELDLVPIPELAEAFRFEGNVLAALLDCNFVCHPAVAGKRKVFLENGGYDETFRRAQDYELWLRLVNHGCQFAHIDDPLCFYRTHESQITRSDGGMLNSEYGMAAVQKLVDDNETPHDIRMLARNTLTERHRKQAWRYQAFERPRDVRRHYAAAFQSCPSARNLITYLLYALRLDRTPIMKCLRWLKPHDSSHKNK